MKSMKIETGTKVLLRAESAGVFYGTLSAVDSDVVTLINSRRIWSWYGAASLSQLAQEGVNSPDECKFGVVEPVKMIRGWVEITPLTPEALEILDSVQDWRV